MFRLLHRLALVALLASLLAFAPPAHAPATASTWTEAPADASAFVADVNAARAAQGLPALKVDGSMTAAARGWAIWMAENDTLQHAGDIVSGAPSDWTKVGENVGRGGTVSSVWNAFMASPGHAANVLDPAYTRVGIAVVWTPEGMLYTTHRFAGASSDAGAPAPATPTPAPQPTATPVAAPAATPVPVSSEPAPDPTPPPEPTVPAPPTDPTPELRNDQPPDLAFGGEPIAPPASPERIEATMRVLLASLG